MFSASPDQTIRVWGIQPRGCAQVIRAHDGPVTGISLHATGDYLLSCATDGVSQILCSTFITQLIIFKMLSILRPKQNDSHFADNILKSIFLNENIWIFIKISLIFISDGPIIAINNILALVQIMALHWTSDKRFSEPMIVSLLTCITRPQWVNINIPKFAPKGLEFEV